MARTPGLWPPLTLCTSARYLSLVQGGHTWPPTYAGFEPVDLKSNYRLIFNHNEYRGTGPRRTLGSEVQAKRGCPCTPFCSLAQPCEFAGAAPALFPPEKLQTFSLVRKPSLGFPSWMGDGLGKRSVLDWHALSLGRVKNGLVETQGSISLVGELTVWDGLGWSR